MSGIEEPEWPGLSVWQIGRLLQQKRSLEAMLSAGRLCVLCGRSVLPRTPIRKAVTFDNVFVAHDACVASGMWLPAGWEVEPWPGT